MGKIFQTDFQHGSYIDKISKAQGTNTNGVFKKTEKGLAWKGNGNTSSINYADILDLMPTDVFYVRAWVKYSGTGGSFQMIGGRRKANSPFSGWMLAIASGNVIFRFVDDSITLRVANGGSVNDNQWHEVIGVSDGNKVQIYVDGVYKDEDNNSLGTVTNAANFKIGNSGDSNNDGFVGYISKFDIYNEIFSNQKVCGFYEEFLTTKLVEETKYWNGLERINKPTDLSRFVEDSESNVYTSDFSSSVDGWTTLGAITLTQPESGLIRGTYVSGGPSLAKNGIGSLTSNSRVITQIRGSKSMSIRYLYGIGNIVTHTITTEWQEIENVEKFVTYNNLYIGWATATATAGDWFELRYVEVNKKTGLVAAYNMIPSKGGVLTDISGNGNNGTINGAISTLNGMKFDGIGDYVDTGFKLSGNSFTILCRIKRNNGGSFSIMQGDSSVDKRTGIAWGSDDRIYLFIGIASGLAYGFIPNIDFSSVLSIAAIYDGSEPVPNNRIKLYIDGELSSFTSYVGTIPTSITESIVNLQIGTGYNGGQYSDGDGNNVCVSNKILSEQEIKDYHNSFVLPYRTESFEYDPVGSNLPREWIPGTGTFQIKELTVADTVLNLPIGTKYLECISAGTIAYQNTQAQGNRKFCVNKGNDANSLNLRLTAMNILGQSGYSLSLGITEDIRFVKTGVDVLFTTIPSYISNNTWYCFDIDNENGGTKTVKISGGTFGNVPVLVDPTGGSGTNPVTDNTYTESEYTVLDLDVGDKFIPDTQLTGIKQ